MHSLIHLADDVKYMGATVSYFTAFPFENALGKMKKLLRSGKSPSAQVCRRLYEQADFATANTDSPKIEIIGKKIQDSDGNTLVRKVKMMNFIISIREGDNLVLLKDKTVKEISEIFILAGRISN